MAKALLPGLLLQRAPSSHPGSPSPETSVLSRGNSSVVSIWKELARNSHFTGFYDWVKVRTAMGRPHG